MVGFKSTCRQACEKGSSCSVCRRMGLLCKTASPLHPPSSSKALGCRGDPHSKIYVLSWDRSMVSDFVSREFLPRTPDFMHDLAQNSNCNTGHKGTTLVETGCLHALHSLHRTTMLWGSWFLQSVCLLSPPRPFPHSSCLPLED